MKPQVMRARHTLHHTQYIAGRNIVESVQAHLKRQLVEAVGSYVVDNIGETYQKVVDDLLSCITIHAEVRFVVFSEPELLDRDRKLRKAAYNRGHADALRGVKGGAE